MMNELANEYKNEYRVAKRSDIPPGSMKQVEAGETTLLLSHVEGQVYAISGHCSHYGAPLVQGALSGKQVICPWHHACFDVTSGDHLDPPGLNALTRFAVRIDGEDIYVRVPENANPQREPAATGRRDGQTFVLLGGGVAAENAAETLRDEGFTGRLVMITRDDYAPYNRTDLSKKIEASADPGELELRDRTFYEERDIELMFTEVGGLSAAEKTLTFEDGETLAFDKLLVATGSVPRRLDVPGADLAGVFTLRTLQDAKRLLAAAEQGDRAVLVGSSFIALELASALQEKNVSVSVVAPEPVPFEKVLGERVGKKIQRNHERQGTTFYLGQKVKALAGTGRAERVVLEDGRELAADFVVVGIGVTPATDFLEGLELAEDGGVEVDATLKAAESIYAAGDIAQFPLPRTGEQVRIEHWRLAAQHGRTAARNMLGHNEPYSGVPYFWSAQPDLKLRYVGHAEGFDDIIIDGDVDGGEFIAYYLKDGAVRAAAGVERDTELAAVEHLIKQDKLPSPSELRKGVKLLELL